MTPAEHGSPPPSAGSVFPMITAYMTSQVIYLAARLGIAELLQDGARSGDELARPTGTHAPSLRRLLRGLAVVGVVDEAEPRRTYSPSGSTRSRIWSCSARIRSLIFAVRASCSGVSTLRMSSAVVTA